jgi:hypothetical protein
MFFINVAASGKCRIAAENVTNVKFNGTKSQWIAYLSDDIDLSRTSATYVQCSDGQVAL